MSEQCMQYPIDIDGIDKEKLSRDMQLFCSKFRSNKPKEYVEAFLNLPIYVQCLFAYYCSYILKGKMQGDTRISDSAFIAGKRLYTLFKNPAIKLKQEVHNILNRFDIRKEHLDFAQRWVKGIDPMTPIQKTVFAKPYQKKPALNITDPLFRFYNSLYEEKPNSKLAIVWLTEHGAFDDQKREDLIKRFRMISGISK